MMSGFTGLFVRGIRSRREKKYYIQYVATSGHLCFLPDVGQNACFEGFVPGPIWPKDVAQKR